MVFLNFAWWMADDSRRIRGDLRRYISAGSDEVAHVPVYIWFSERKGR